MGSFMSALQRPIGVAAENLTGIIRGRKRKREEDFLDSNDDNSDLELSMSAPKKKKLITTAQYIYQALYKEERNSDVAVMALGKIWRLHKIYLSQSPYFASMFCGSWKESSQDFIKIEIIDPNISVDSLSLVFGSLYLDEVELDPNTVVTILATSALFQLDGLMDKCTEVMMEMTNAETAVLYYEAACKYGIAQVQKFTFNWLLVNLMSLYAKNLKWLKSISVELMYALISNPELYVIPTEFSLYILLKFWVFIQLNPDFDWNNKNNIKDVPANYFNKREGNDIFLETTNGRRYEKVYRMLRIQHLLNHHLDLMTLIEDRIIPRSWLNLPLFNQWSSMLKIDEAIDKGPKECDEETFNKNCLRCGRTLQEEGFQKWRWNGFNFGLDLVLITDTRILSIKRNHRTENERLLSLQVKRKFYIRVTIASLNEFRQIKYTQTTGIKSLSLDKNEQYHLLVMDKELVYPLLISVNLLVITPNNDIETIESNNQILDDPNILPSVSSSPPSPSSSTATSSRSNIENNSSNSSSSRYGTNTTISSSGALSISPKIN